MINKFFPLLVWLFKGVIPPVF